ncbi:MAG: tetratricopeptide repeat protein [Caulobacteraceae bacterium]|nr:tetratricopeptide repeat protein [Caulobacteraceae bacterium]
MVDVFEEVEEQLRSDRYRTLARKYLPGVLGVLALVLVIFLGWWGYTAYKAKAAERASQAYAEGLDKLEHGDTGGAFLAFAMSAKGSSPAYRYLALMQQGGIRLNANDPAQAANLFDEAAKAAPDQPLGDAARLKSALAVLDTASYADLEARLTPLADAKRPYHALAKEALAMTKLRFGKVAEARKDFVVLSLTEDAGDDMRQRAKIALTVIDSGAAAGIPATVKAALSAPTPPPSAPAVQQSQPGAAQ